MTVWMTWPYFKHNTQFATKLTSDSPAGRSWIASWPSRVWLPTQKWTTATRQDIEIMQTKQSWGNKLPSKLVSCALPTIITGPPTSSKSIKLVVKFMFGVFSISIPATRLVISCNWGTAAPKMVKGYSLALSSVTGMTLPIWQKCSVSKAVTAKVWHLKLVFNSHAVAQIQSKSHHSRYVEATMYL